MLLLVLLNVRNVYVYDIEQVKSYIGNIEKLMGKLILFFYDDFIVTNKC